MPADLFQEVHTVSIAVLLDTSVVFSYASCNKYFSCFYLTKFSGFLFWAITYWKAQKCLWALYSILPMLAPSMIHEVLSMHFILKSLFFLYMTTTFRAFGTKLCKPSTMCIYTPVQSFIVHQLVFVSFFFLCQFYQVRQLIFFLCKMPKGSKLQDVCGCLQHHSNTDS